MPGSLMGGVSGSLHNRLYDLINYRAQTCRHHGLIKSEI